MHFFHFEGRFFLVFTFLFILSGKRVVFMRDVFILFIFLVLKLSIAVFFFRIFSFCLHYYHLVSLLNYIFPFWSYFSCFAVVATYFEKLIYVSIFHRRILQQCVLVSCQVLIYDLLYFACKL